MPSFKQSCLRSDRTLYTINATASDSPAGNLHKLIRFGNPLITLEKFPEVAIGINIVGRLLIGTRFRNYVIFT